MIEPRPYQIEALESVLDRRSKGINRQLISLPTGTGKTVVFALLAKELNLRTIILAHTQELIEQAVAKLKMVWPEVDVGVVKAASDEINAQVVVASVQTASRDKRLQKLKEQNFELLIADECHHAVAPSYVEVLKELGFLKDDPSKLLIGVTATPRRGDGAALGTIFQEIIFDRSISTMIRSGYLSNLVGKQIFTKTSLENVGISRGDFIQGELARVVNTDSRNRLVVSSHTQYAKERKKTLVFCADVQHAKDLAELFQKNGLPSKAVYGDLDKEERTAILEEFSDGKIQVLTNCQLLTEGFDQPSIDCVILARPTKSSSLYIQMLGRGTRTSPLKRDCLILDFCDNASRNDLCSYKNVLDGVVMPIMGEEWIDDDERYERLPQEKTAQNNRSKEPNVFVDRVENIQFFDSSKFAWNQVGDSWHLILSQDRHIWLRKIKGGYLIVAHSNGEVIKLSSRPLPLDYALGVAEDWSRKQTTKSAWARKDAPWRSLPATQRQLDALAKGGIRFGHGITKGEAAEILDARMSEPATSKQLFYLKTNGIPFQPGITKIEASKMIAKEKNICRM